jgi:stage V sporulation protein G
MIISRLFIYEGQSGNTRAFVDLVTSEGIILKGFKLILGPTGLFLAAPSEKGKDGKWRESVIIPKELKNELNKIVVNEYEKLRASGKILLERIEENEEELPF